MSGAKRSECVGLSACVKHGHVVPSKNCKWLLSIQTIVALSLDYEPPNCQSHYFSLSLAHTFWPFVCPVHFSSDLSCLLVPDSTLLHFRSIVTPRCTSYLLICWGVILSYSCILSTHYTHFLKYQLQIFSLSKFACGLIKKLLLTSVYLCKMSDHLLTITSDCHGLELLSSHSLCQPTDFQLLYNLVACIEFVSSTVS